MGEPGEQLRLNDRCVTQDRCRAIENIVQRAQGSGRITFRQADHRARIAYLTGAGPLFIERRKAGAGFG